MAITTLDGVIAGAQPPVAWAKDVTPTLVTGRPQSLYQLAGIPGAGSMNTGLAGANYSSSSSVPNGILYHKDPASGNSYLARFIASCQIAGTLLLCDRLWDNALTMNSTSAQTINTAAWPARSADGTTGGLGVELAVEVSSATSATAAVISVSYTNSAGTAGKIGTFIDTPTAAAASVGQFYRISQAAGDQGVQSVQTVTFSTAWTSGQVGLVAYRVLAMLECPVAYTPNAVDALTAGFPQLYNGTCMFMVFLPSTTTASAISGCTVETQG